MDGAGLAAEVHGEILRAGPWDDHEVDVVGDRQGGEVGNCDAGACCGARYVGGVR